MIYLDNNATTKPAREVAGAVAGALERHWHNPSSAHRAGQEARREVELARVAVARLIGAEPRDIIYTAGGTESIHLAIRGVTAVAKPGRRTIVTTAVEHESVRDLCEHLAHHPINPFQTRLVPLDADGIIDLDALAGLIDDSIAIVSIQWANNETGIVQPVADIAALCRERGVPFHCDATQWVGKAPTDIDPDSGIPIDLLTFSAHKFHGPKGAGALYVRRGVRLQPLFHGVQERERRAGTENVPGIVGMGVAADLAVQWLVDPTNRASVAALRDRLERGVLERVPGSVVNGPRDDRRLWNTTNIGFPKLEAEALLIALSERGLCASAGAACSSGSLDPSPVLKAIGIPDQIAHGSLRFSLSRDTTADEIDRAIELIAECVARVARSATSVA